MDRKTEKLYENLLKFQAILLREAPTSFWCRAISDLTAYVCERNACAETNHEQLLQIVKKELLALYAPKEGGLSDFYVYREDRQEMTRENHQLRRIVEEIFDLLG